MPGLRSDIDPNGLLEYSVVFTDRSVNHMSGRFQQTMRELLASLAEVYNAQTVTFVPGGGTYAMEAVARQFVQGQPCLILRNGWFSYRWTQIIDAAGLTDRAEVRKARQVDSHADAPFAPAPIDEVVAAIDAQKPAVVFAPHVETASGILLPDDYIAAVAEATRRNGGLFVLDCIASGAVWVDMQATGVDVLISAPQKGWSGSPCAGIVMMNDRAGEQLTQTQSSSFALDLKKWREIAAAYENGAHAYHATMPTDGLLQLHATLSETQAFGIEAARQAQLELGARVRELLQQHGYQSVAAPGFEAPGVVVSYTDDAGIGGRFAAAGLQIAVGVPLQCDEPEGFQTFRLGLFGLDKLGDIPRTVGHLADALAGFEAG